MYAIYNPYVFPVRFARQCIELVFFLFKLYILSDGETKEADDQN